MCVLLTGVAAFKMDLEGLYFASSCPSSDSESMKPACAADLALHKVSAPVAVAYYHQIALGRHTIILNLVVAT